ncbi:polycystin-1-like protein 3 [Ptychodera flava]|uniref:polycystin-1-like protein 3 n=1 Tax=Ptychodera flava TaxID=63121 RepID=UPI003969CF7E
MNEGIEKLQNFTAGREETYHDSDVLMESVLKAADSLAKFVLRNTEPSSGPLLVETLSIRLNLDSDSVEKLANASVMMGDGNGFILPPAEALFPNLSQQTTVNRIVSREQHTEVKKRIIWLKGSLFQRGNNANDVLSLSFTDREGNELPVNDTKEDISIIFPSDPPRTDTNVLINGVYIEADGITYFRTTANISYVPHATVIHLESSEEFSVNVTANIFKDCGVINSTQYSGYQYSVDAQFNRGQSSIFIPEHEFPLTGTYKITVALPQKHDVRLSMHVKQIMCGYLDEISGTWNSDGCKVSPASNLTSTVCLCDHLTAFATREN